LTSIKESIARKIYADIDIKEFMQKDNFEQVVRDILESKMLETLKQNTIRFSKANSSEEICKIIFNEYKNE